MKKLFAIVMVVAMMLSMSVVASAGQSATIEYDGSKAVITVSTTEAFETIDVGVISEATCTVVAQAMDFGMNNLQDPSITYSGAVNAAAADAAGNAYAVATGAGYKQIDATTSEPIPYVGAVYTFTYDNVAEGTEFTVVSGTATVEDVTTATVVTTLKASTAPEETATPAPTETPAPTPTAGNDNPKPTAGNDDPKPTAGNDDVKPSDDGNDDKKDDVKATDKPSDDGKKPAPQTADVAPVATMITLVVVAGLAIVALKKRATN